MDSRSVVLRNLAPSDQTKVRSLILAGLGEHWGYVDETLNPDLDDIGASYGHGRTIVACMDDDIVGTGTIVPVDRSSSSSSSKAEIVRLAVASAHRRAGLGHVIVAELLRTAEEWGATSVVLETTTSWGGSIAFYLSCGFVVTGEEEGRFGRDTWFEMVL